MRASLVGYVFILSYFSQRLFARHRTEISLTFSSNTTTIVPAPRTPTMHTKQPFPPLTLALRPA